ncbi:MAG: hypothetical protein ACMXYF_05785 [Candidatus Woesearchaeota archaeon]
MNFHIETLGFEKIIKKLRKHPLKEKIMRDIDSLATNPFLGKYLTNHEKYELKYPNLRIYYIVKEGTVIVYDTIFDGLIIIEAFGTKNHQKRFLRKKD